VLPSKTIVLGVLDLSLPEPEPAGILAERIRQALKHVAAPRLVIAPDCGMKFLSRPLARAQLEAMVAALRLAAG
jgi:5-methyltetrahydropteroyltriglutamate--homocysteine methyltransferase